MLLEKKMMQDKIVHISFDISEEDHKKLTIQALEQGCPLQSLLRKGVHSLASGEMRPEQNGQAYTIEEIIFYLSRYAECMEIDKTITVPDERELFWMILDWADKFELESGVDFQNQMETQGAGWLRETFPYTPELDWDVEENNNIAGPIMDVNSM